MTVKKNDKGNNQCYVSKKMLKLIAELENRAEDAEYDYEKLEELLKEQHQCHLVDLAKGNKLTEKEKQAGRDYKGI